MGQFFFALAFVAAVGAASPSLAADKNTDLARDLIDKFYDALAPERTSLEGFLNKSFQIIGTDGLHFDRSEYLKFPKKIIVEVLEPCMTVFQRINGEWRAAAHANFAAIK